MYVHVHCICTCTCVFHIPSRQCVCACESCQVIYGKNVHYYDDDTDLGSHDQKESKELSDNPLDLLLPSVPLPPSSVSVPPNDPQESEIDRIKSSL